MTLQPPSTLRVGVTGHRADKLRDDAAARISPVVAEALQRLRGLLGQGARLQVVSPLAEGADRLAARLGVEQGADLIALLPFPRDQYLDDFSGVPSRAEFNALLSRAKEVITLEGNHATEQGRKAAYAAVGAAVVDHSDVMLALWNGEAAEGHGGTAEVVQSARRAGRPVLWLPTTSRAPHLLLADCEVVDGAIDAFVGYASEILAKRSTGIKPEKFSLARDRHLFGPGPKRILALDGGGVRGIVSIAFLERLEKTVEEIEGKPVLLGDWFDLIGGTSTGAIIGTLLALGYRAADIKKFYDELAPRVFKSSFWRIAGVRAKFDAENLTGQLAKLLGGRTVGDDEIRTGLCVVTKRVDTGSAWVIVNNPRGLYWNTPPDNSFTGNRHYPLANLIRASTAAPHFFDPQRIEIAPNTPPGLFVDGGVSPHNNPSLYMFLIAYLPQYGLNWKLGPENLTVVSIGTGTFRYRMPANLPVWVKNLGMTIHALASQMSDSQQLTLAIMSLFGSGPTVWPINSELGDLGTTPPPGGKPLFHFLRYDVRLERDWLQRELGVALDEPKLAVMRRLEAVENMAEFYDLGARAAAHQIKPEHLVRRG